jgi:hypothetical protein
MTEKKKISIADKKREKEEAEAKKNAEDSTNVFDLKFTARELVGFDEETGTLTSTSISSTIDHSQSINLNTNGTNIDITRLLADAKVEVNTLEVQTKLIAIFASEAKILESEMNKLIKGAYGKAPGLKPYFLKMKKLLAQHADIQSTLDKAKKICEAHPEECKKKAS